VAANDSDNSGGCRFALIASQFHHLAPNFAVWQKNFQCRIPQHVGDIHGSSQNESLGVGCGSIKSVIPPRLFEIDSHARLQLQRNRHHDRVLTAMTSATDLHPTPPADCHPASGATSKNIGNGSRSLDPAPAQATMVDQHRRAANRLSDPALRFGDDDDSSHVVKS